MKKPPDPPCSFAPLIPRSAFLPSIGTIYVGLQALASTVFLNGDFQALSPSFSQALTTSAFMGSSNSFSRGDFTGTDYISSGTIRFKNFFDCQGVFLLPFPSFSLFLLLIEFQNCDIWDFDSNLHVKGLIIRACLIKIRICFLKVLAKDKTFKVSFFITCFNYFYPCLIIPFFQNNQSSLVGNQCSNYFIGLCVEIINRSLGCSVKNGNSSLYRNWWQVTWTWWIRTSVFKHLMFPNHEYMSYFVVITTLWNLCYLQWDWAMGHSSLSLTDDGVFLKAYYDASSNYFAGYVFPWGRLAFSRSQPRVPLYYESDVLVAAFTVLFLIAKL